MTISDFVGIAAVVLTVCGAVGGIMLALGKSALIGVISTQLKPLHQEMQPLRDAILGLKATAELLAREIADGKAAQRESRNELHDAVEAIRDVLRKHEERFGAHDTRIAILENATPTSLPTIRVRGKR